MSAPSLNPTTTKETIRQRVVAKEMALEAKKDVLPYTQEFGLKLWTNKLANSFIETDELGSKKWTPSTYYRGLEGWHGNVTVTEIYEGIP